MNLVEALSSLDKEQFGRDYEEALRRHNHHGKQRRNALARDELASKYPWLGESMGLRAMEDTQEGRLIAGVLGEMGNASVRVGGRVKQPRLIGARANGHVNGRTSQPQEPTNGKKGPSPTITVKAWLDEHGELRATYQELAHFTGYTDAAFSGVIRKLEGEGYVFDRASGVLRVVSRPDSKQKQEMKQEIATLESMLKELKAKMDKM